MRVRAPFREKLGKGIWIAGAVLMANLAFAFINKANAEETGKCPNPPDTCTTSNTQCADASYPSCNLCFLTDIFGPPYPCILNN